MLSVSRARDRHQVTYGGGWGGVGYSTTVKQKCVVSQEIIAVLWVIQSCLSLSVVTMSALEIKKKGQADTIEQPDI